MKTAEDTINDVCNISAESLEYSTKQNPLMVDYFAAIKAMHEYASQFYTADEVREIIIQRDRDIIRGRFHNNIDHYLTK